jgi:hypothetical protein
MAVATGLIIALSVGVAAGTTAVATREQNMASKSAATAAGGQGRAQAAQMEMQAQAEKTQATADELDRQRTLQRIVAAQNAVFGASGADPLSGSFANVQTADANKAAEATRLNQMFTDTRQVGFSNSIKNIESQAQMTRNASKIARRTNTIGGVGSVLRSGTSGYAGYSGEYQPRGGQF